MRYENLMFGSDPELFLKTSTGKLISAIGRIGGTKHAPLPIDDHGSAVQEDNVAVEFNTAPSKTKEEFLRSLAKPLSYIEAKVKEMGLELEIVPSAMFDDDQLEDPMARMFGCDTDYCVWTGRPNAKPKASGDTKNLRTAGGHLHMSWNNPNTKDVVAMVKTLDLFLGVPSVLMDNDSRRRLLYGKAGAFRPKNYGLEYRVLSNFWIKSEALSGWVIDQANTAADFLRQGNVVDFTTRSQILTAINSSHQSVAEHLVKKYNLNLLAA